MIKEYKYWQKIVHFIRWKKTFKLKIYQKFVPSFN